MHRLFASSWRYWITKIIKARQISQCSSHGFLPYKCTYLRADVASHPLHSWTKWRSPLRKFRLLLMESFKQSGCKSQNWPVLLKNNGKKKPRESLVSKQTEYWVPVSWGLCAVVGFRNDWFAFLQMWCYICLLPTLWDRIPAMRSVCYSMEGKHKKRLMEGSTSYRFHTEVVWNLYFQKSFTAFLRRKSRKLSPFGNLASKATVKLNKWINR